MTEQDFSGLVHSSSYRCSKGFVGSGLERTRIMVFDLTTHSVVRDLDVELAYPSSIAITNDGQHVLLQDKWLVRVYATRGTIVRTFGQRVESLDLHPDDDGRTAIGTHHGKLEIWNWHSGTPTGTEWQVDTNEDMVSWVKYNADGGSRLLTQTWSVSQVWDVGSASPIGKPFPFLSDISRDGAFVAYATSREVYVVNAASGDFRFSTPIRFDWARPKSVAFHPNADSLLLEVQTNSITPYHQPCCDYLSAIFDAGNGSQVTQFVDAFRSDALFLSIPKVATDSAVRCEDYRVLFFDLTATRLVAHHDLPGFCRAANLSCNGKYLVVACDSEVVAPASAEPYHRPQHIPFSGTPDPSGRSGGIRSTIADSNVSSTANTILVDALANGVPSPVCVGFSEVSLTDALVNAIQGRLPAKYIIPDHPGYLLQICGTHDPFRSRFDVQGEHIELRLPLHVDLVRPHPRSDLRLARIKLVLMAKFTPSFNVGTEQSVEIVLKDVQKEDVETIVVYPTEILGQFGSIPAFVDFAERTINAVVQTSISGVGNFLPTVAAHLPLSAFWNRVSEYEFIFRGFQFKTTIVTDDDGKQTKVGYLFMLFSVASYGLPPKCICPTESAVRSFARTTAELDKLAVIAVSEAALNTLAEPHRNTGNEASETKGGRLYCHVRGYFASRLGQLRILDTGVASPVEFVRQGGTAKAGLRDWIDNDIVTASVGIRLQIRDAAVTWNTLVRTETQNEEQVTRLYLEPFVFINPRNIEVHLETPLPGPLNDLLSFMVDWFLTAFSTVIQLGIWNVGFIELSYNLVEANAHNKEGFHFHFTNAAFYPRSSIVVLGILDYQIPH